MERPVTRRYKTPKQQASSPAKPLTQTNLWQNLGAELIQIVLLHLGRGGFQTLRLVCKGWRVAAGTVPVTVRLEYVNKKTWGQTVEKAHVAFPLCVHWQLQLLDTTHVDRAHSQPHWRGHPGPARGHADDLKQERMTEELGIVVKQLAVLPIKKLDLFLFGLNSQYAIDLAPLASCSTLTTLCVHRLANAIGPTRNVWLSAVSALTQLQELELVLPSTITILRPGPSNASILSSLTQLRRLVLRGMTVTTAPDLVLLPPDLTPLAHLPSLQSLTLERASSRQFLNQPPTDAGNNWEWSSALTPLAQLTQLRIASLNIRMSPTEAQALAALTALQELHLYLSSTSHDDGLAMLVPPLAAGSALHSLTLQLETSSPGICINGCLMRTAQLTSLRQLHLTYRKAPQAPNAREELTRLSVLTQLQDLHVACYQEGNDQQTLGHPQLDGTCLQSLLAGCVALQQLSFRGVVRLVASDLVHLRAHQPLHEYRLQAVNLRGQSSDPRLFPTPLHWTRPPGSVHWEAAAGSAVETSFLADLQYQQYQLPLQFLFAMAGFPLNIHPFQDPFPGQMFMMPPFPMMMSDDEDDEEEEEEEEDPYLELHGGY